ncbi:MAG: ribosome silencing factor [Pseudomonadota bacterium]
MARLVANAILEKKGEDVVILHIGERSSIADYFVIATAHSERQLRALAASIEDALRPHGERPLGSEGLTGSQWALVDFGSVVAHLFHDEARFIYDLEGLWQGAKHVLVEDVRAAAAP